MAFLQQLTNEQIDEAIQNAAARQAPLVVTVREDRGWVNLYSRFVAAEDQYFLIEPARSDEQGVRVFKPADRISLSFKLGHHKHIFSAIVAGQMTRSVDGQEQTVLRLVSPTRMQRMQRRNYQRVAVPSNRLVRASLWLGGRDNEPVGSDASRLVLTGSVDDLSAGGFRLICKDCGGMRLQPGDAVGVHLSFDLGREGCYANAQLRHLTEEEGAVLLGLQFIALPQSQEGRLALRLISDKVAEFQRAHHSSERQRQAS